MIKLTTPKIMRMIIVFPGAYPSPASDKGEREKGNALFSSPSCWPGI